VNASISIAAATYSDARDRQTKNYQCVLKLASVIVHEVWHLKNGASETGAYNAQLAFLMANQGALEQMTDVRRSRSQAVAAERKAVEAARRLSSAQAR